MDRHCRSVILSEMRRLFARISREALQTKFICYDLHSSEQLLLTRIINNSAIAGTNCTPQFPLTVWALMYMDFCLRWSLANRAHQSTQPFPRYWNHVSFMDGLVEFDLPVWLPGNRKPVTKNMGQSGGCTNSLESARDISIRLPLLGSSGQKQSDYWISILKRFETFNVTVKQRGLWRLYPFQSQGKVRLGKA